MQKQVDSILRSQDSERNGNDWSITKEAIEAALERTPTGGNSKPFTWNWNGDVLQVVHHQELAAHYLNRHEHTSWIALGCLVTSVEVVAQSFGYQMTYQVSKNLSSEFKFVKVKSSLGSVDDLKSLFQRRTYRGSLRVSAAPQMPASLNSDSVKVHVVENTRISSKFKKYLMQSDSYLWLQKKATQDFFKEIVFASDKNEHQRGIEVKDLGIGLMDRIMLRVFRKMRWLPSLLARIPGLNVSFRANTMRTLRNAHMVLLTSKDLQPLSLLHAGQQAMRTWIELEKQGYKVQPLSMASITLVDAANQALPDDTLESFKKLFQAEGPQVLSDEFQLGADEKPVWLLRVGKV